MNVSEHLERLRARSSNTYALDNLAAWVEKYSFMNGRPYSFKNYEYQKAILADAANTTIVIKPSQIGMSELSYRFAVAMCCTQDDFTAIYTFPTASDAQKANVTRIDPIVQGSPEIARLVSKDLDNSEIKQFGSNSFLFFKGTTSATQALSTSANAVIHDEFDKSDPETASVYVSRLQNRPHKLRKIFSTPTIAKVGVSKEAEVAKRYYHLKTCSRCNHSYLPDYFNDVKIPGWDKPMQEITRNNLHTIAYKDAQLLCPSCLQPAQPTDALEFVCENSDSNYDAHAYYLSPFSVPNIIPLSYTIQSSTQFLRYSEFMNQGLGLTAEEESESITQGDIEQATLQSNLYSSDLHVMGCDMGVTCWAVVARLAHDGTFIVVHRQAIHYTEFEETTRQLAVRFRVCLTICDSQPFTDLVTRLSRARQNFYGALFNEKKGSEAHTVVNQAADPSEGKMSLKLVKISRTLALDTLLAAIKSGRWAVQSSDQDATYLKHMLSMKRTLRADRLGELAYTWAKTDGEDHYHMATLYAFTACSLRGMVGGVGASGTAVPLVGKMRLNNW